MRLLRLFKNDFRRDITDWVTEGIINADQARKIANRYGIDIDNSATNAASGYRVLTSLAYLFIGMALITLLSANWDEIPRALRMGGLITITAITQLLALRRYVTGAADSGANLFFLGNLFYGASIILIAQIYHLGEHMPDGIFWWALGCLPTALLLRNHLLLLQTLTLALIWFFVEAGMGFYPTLLPLFIAGAIYVLRYSDSSKYLFLITLIITALWFEYSLAYWWGDMRYFRFIEEHVIVSMALLILAYSVGHWLSNRPGHRAQDYAALLTVWTLRLGLLGLFIFSFNDTWLALLRTEWQQLAAMLSISVGLVIAALALAYRHQRFTSTLVISAIYLLCLGLIVFGHHLDGPNYINDPATHYNGNLLSLSLWLQVITNLALLGCGIRLIILGTHTASSQYFFAGILTILATALIRYFDLIGDYIGGAILFIIFAIILLAAARYWQKQVWPNKFQEQQDAQPAGEKS